MKLILDNQGTANCERYIEYISSGLFKTSPGWQHHRRRIDDYALIFVLDGDVHLREGATTVDLMPGDCFILSPQIEHEGYAPSDMAVSYYWVHFQSNLFSSASASERYLHLSDSFQVQNLFKQLLHIVNSETYPRYMAALYLAMIIGEIEHTKMKTTRKSNALASEVHEYIKVHSADTMLNLAQIAEHFGFSSDYIGRLFKNEYRINIKDYIVREKIHAAKHYLNFTYLSVKEIASKLGFEDTDKFIKFFKYHENISPAKYRNTYTNTHINKI